MYTNHIIRVTYKCNWKCKFCNVIKTNNFGEKDVTDDEVIDEIISLSKSYGKLKRNDIYLCFSGGEPTLNSKLLSYIKLARKLGFGNIEVQTNGTTFYRNKEKIYDFIEAGVDGLFISQHSNIDEINKNLGSYFNVENFLEWVEFIKKEELYKKINIDLNIVINKINLPYLQKYIEFMHEIGFYDIINHKKSNTTKNKIVNFTLVQPNGYAQLNKDEVILEFNEEQLNQIKSAISLLESYGYSLFMHFTCPPLCILNYPEYNTEYQLLKKIEKDTNDGTRNDPNMVMIKKVEDEKIKFEKCNGCKYNKYCYGLYKSWVDYVGEEYAENKVNNFVSL